nr:MAG TPA: hypothetical protein [Caudoviricetes sp.]
MCIKRCQFLQPCLLPQVRLFYVVIGEWHIVSHKNL